MDDASTKKRQVRLLRLLAKRPANLHDTATEATKVLEFAGERSVRCSSADLAAARRCGCVSLRKVGGAEVLSITDTGRAALRRHDTGDFVGQHRLLRTGEVKHAGGREAVTVNDAESPLANLARLRRPDGTPWLDRAELVAGDRLRCDFERAMLQPRVTASWDLSHVARSGSGKRDVAAELSDRAVAARERVNAAVEAVGPDLGGALVDVCCFLKGLEQVERERDWPRRSAKLMLKTALAMLDRHYHPPDARARHSRKTLHWGGQGYRPPLA